MQALGLDTLAFRRIILRDAQPATFQSHHQPSIPNNKRSRYRKKSLTATKTTGCLTEFVAYLSPAQLSLTARNVASDKNCSKYDGNLTFDVRRWLKTLSIMLDIRQAHPDIWHLVGFCLIEGSARERLLLVIGSDDEPKNWDSFCKWTLSLNTLDPEVINAYNKRVVADDYEDLHQGKNETVEEFYTRFMKWQCKARYHGYEHDPETMFVNRLKKGLRRKISGLIAIENRRGTPMSFNIVVEAALDEDRAYGRSRR
ncbi:hypothetical protein Pst134EA_017530 [Puccinia striiformis f. sp. tritici]|uniref:hypothetical protein n=1 Tax=Puccinia striiformis f. sp. tritici TaxID=168172 RepID=UPI002007CDE8|nr:hypothetical protein Pst134EA_017530 [Puccinia striiformis f. sp. tritici]KAH9450919.1 hypothetical protein Pst134EB_018428 [Puccinia striiformis f. sp. tritici]KAH9461221.1 hypothetical protein Pst134EA_017530 [Puccinia striiformis f. sp. tritici]